MKTNPERSAWPALITDVVTGTIPYAVSGGWVLKALALGLFIAGLRLISGFARA